MTSEETARSLAESLLPTLGSVRRNLRRVAGGGFFDEELTAAQREVALLVGRRPGRSVSDVASELGLRPNTVSTIVSQLVAKGVMVRETDPVDRRVGRLTLTPQAQARADAARFRRREVLADVLRRLDPQQVADLRAGVAALAALAEALRRAADAEGQP